MRGAQRDVGLLSRRSGLTPENRAREVSRTGALTDESANPQQVRSSHHRSLSGSAQANVPGAHRRWSRMAPELEVLNSVDVRESWCHSRSVDAARARSWSLSPTVVG